MFLLKFALRNTVGFIPGNILSGKILHHLFSSAIRNLTPDLKTKHLEHQVIDLPQIIGLTSKI
uniref:Uncharacterized protein n=1 Tax=Candidatus Nitrotoga fabula TaxID=2182327 RepID=A0A2X0QXU5_9PROT|nr:protein of unknown function [Candidatus Nitrotoga fabula]